MDASIQKQAALIAQEHKAIMATCILQLGQLFMEVDRDFSHPQKSIQSTMIQRTF